MLCTLLVAFSNVSLGCSSFSHNQMDSSHTLVRLSGLDRRCWRCAGAEKIFGYSCSSCTNKKRKTKIEQKGKIQTKAYLLDKTNRIVIQNGLIANEMFYIKLKWNTIKYIFSVTQNEKCKKKTVENRTFYPGKKNTANTISWTSKNKRPKNINPSSTVQKRSSMAGKKKIQTQTHHKKKANLSFRTKMSLKMFSESVLLCYHIKDVSLWLLFWQKQKLLVASESQQITSNPQKITTLKPTPFVQKISSRY